MAAPAPISAAGRAAIGQRSSGRRGRRSGMNCVGRSHLTSAPLLPLPVLTGRGGRGGGSFRRVRTSRERAPHPDLLPVRTGRRRRKRQRTNRGEETDAADDDHFRRHRIGTLDRRRRGREPLKIGARPVDDGPVEHHRQGRGRWRPPLHAAAWRYRGGSEGSAHRQRRRHLAGGRQATGPGIGRQRKGRDSWRRYHAVGAHHRATGDRGEDSNRGHGVGRVDHGRSLALHDPHRIHARPVLIGDRRLGGPERRQEDHHHRQRLGAGPGGRRGLQGPHRQGGRPNPGVDAGAARQPRLRPVPAARPRSQIPIRCSFIFLASRAACSPSSSWSAAWTSRASA